MPQLNHTGPEGQGSGTGRKLGTCKSVENQHEAQLGEGWHLKRRSGGGIGKGLRLKSSKLFENQKIAPNEDCDTNKK